MSNEVTYISRSELEALDVDIAVLEEQIKEAASRMTEARKEGDLRENEEYSLAENDLFRFRKELEEKRTRRSTAVVRDTESSGKISPGSKVSLDISGIEYKDISITADRAQPFKSITVNSKLGVLLIGRRAGDSFTYIDNLFRKQTVHIIGVY